MVVSMERGTTTFTLQANLIIVDVVVNDVAGQFLLDTGAGSSVLTRELAERLQLEEVERAAGAGAGGTVRMSIVRLDSITVAGLTDRAIACPVMDIADVRAHLGDNIDGILGFDFFGSGSLHVDYVNRRVTFERPVRDAAAEKVIVAGNTVRLTQLGLEVTRPSSAWSAKTDTPLPTVALILEGPSGAEIALSTVSAHGLSAGAMKASLDASVAVQVEDFELIESTDLQRAGRPAYRLDYRGTDKARRLQLITEAVLLETGLLVLTCEAPVESFAEVAPDFERALSSLRAYDARDAVASSG